MPDKILKMKLFGDSNHVRLEKKINDFVRYADVAFIGQSESVTDKQPWGLTISVWYYGKAE